MKLPNNMQRRRFIRALGTTLFSGVTLRLTGCGPMNLGRPATTASSLKAGPQSYITVKDIQASPFLGGVLKAKDIAKGEPVTLYFDEGGVHRHAYEVNASHFSKLIAGESVVITTERGPAPFQHTHDVTLNPSNNPPGADSAEIPEEDEPEVLDAYAALSEDEAPEFYLESATKLDSESVEICVGSKEACKEDEDLWKDLVATERFSGRQVFKSAEGLNLSDGEFINVRAKAQELNGILDLILKVTKK